MVLSKKVFNYDNIEEDEFMITNNKIKNKFINPITAGGCLFFKIKDNEIELLLIKYADPKWPLLDDFGGQTKTKDSTIIDTIKRKISEETNGIIDNEIMTDLLENTSNETFYNSTSKYYMKLIQVDDKFYKKTSVFGDVEEADNISRTIKWYKYNKIKKQLAFRLAGNSELINYLDSIIENDD